MSQDKYWEDRKDMHYYKEVLRLARKYAPQAKSVIDVGSMNSPYILQFDWIPVKASLDRYRQGGLEGVTNIHADFLTWTPDQSYDLVLCLQVLEHLDDPTTFCERLKACGKILIVSVPYKWPKGLDPHHVQDPVDEKKLLDWMKVGFITDEAIIKDGTRERLIWVI